MTNHKKLINVIAHWTGTGFVSQRKRRTKIDQPVKMPRHTVFTRIINAAGAYLIFRATNPALLRGRCLFKHRAKFTFFSIFLFNGTLSIC